ncbi:addiction module antitoxin [Burkholderia savannae]|uniref:type II toxin-antitoxin system Phd/YefM family antitoxin n=1 Tax=Burkholderia savannae TaxID=1637837 RepID=UPI00075B9965|nr:type II toxin-antitoxin system Phd/YefM family antitoxin [Burkholderia savannae]AOJ84128.1 addiction module antitoxin [Burkholderia savannae]
MTIRIGDIVPLSIARARFSELADEVRDGGEKIITKNGAAYVALIDARRLDHYHRLERDRAERDDAKRVEAERGDAGRGDAGRICGGNGSDACDDAGGG